MKTRIQIFHYIPGFKFGGIEARTMDLYSCIDKERYQYNVVTFATGNNEMFETIRKDGGKVITVAPISGKSILQHCRDMKLLFRTNIVDVAHCYSSQGGLAFLHYAKKSGVKCRIMHARTSSFEGASNIWIKNLVKGIAVRKANVRLAVSHVAGDWLFGKQKYTVIPNAIDLEKYTYSDTDREKIRLKYGLGDTLTVGHVGRNTFAKNHDFLVRVFSEVVKRIPNAKLMLVGLGEEATNIVDMCKEYGIIDHVVFCGYQINPAPFYSAMDVMVFPSHYEGLPGALIEAQATGLKCFASDRITREVGITPDIEFLSLDAHPKIWAERVVENRKYTRNNNKEIIEKAGFSVKESARLMMNIYKRSKTGI